MFCANCGAHVSEDDSFCRECGAPLIQEKSQAVTVYKGEKSEVQRTSGFAISSLILGIIGFSIFALIFESVAIHQTGKGRNLKGRKIAIAGLVLGTIWFIGQLILISVLIFAIRIFTFL